MEDTQSSGVVYSRKKLQEIPKEIFDLAQREPVKALDLSFNLLTGAEVEDLGGYLRPRQQAGKLEGKPSYDAKSARLRGSIDNVQIGRSSSTKNEPPQLRLPHLEHLWLTSNLLREIPDDLGNLRSLKTLWLNANAIQDIPASFASFVHLEILSVNYNLIGRLRPEIGYMISLKQLLARCNRLGLSEDSRFSTIPAQIGLLTRLEVLDLAENRIVSLPIELGRLATNLERLNLEQNTLRFPSEGIVVQGRMRVMSYLQEIYTERLERFRVKARERELALREHPETLGYTREEANEILASRTIMMGADGVPMGANNRVITPIELDSGYIDI